MSETIEVIKYKGYEIDVCYDTDAESPDQWGDEELFLVYDHRSFFINRDGFDPQEIWENSHSHKLFDGYWVFPLYAYIHSGVSLSLGHNGDPWDASMSGFVLVKREKGWSWTESKATALAEGIVNTWNMYLSGDMYGYNSEVGGCWGFYGEEGRQEMIKEAKSEIDWELNRQIKSHFEKLKIWIKARVPYQYRSECLTI